LSRFYDIHPGEALKKSNDKFYRRFGKVEEHYKIENRSMKEESLEELDKVDTKYTLLISDDEYIYKDTAKLLPILEKHNELVSIGIPSCNEIMEIIDGKHLILN